MTAKRLLCGALLLPLFMALPAAGQEDAGAAATLTVAEIGVGTEYDAGTRDLVGEADTFAAGIEQLWCRTRILGAAEPTTITHVWYREGKTMARVELNVSSPNWRTVSSKKLLPDWTGAWEVKILDAAGTVLATTAFTVE
jgi:hypothetical protein